MEPMPSASSAPSENASDQALFAAIQLEQMTALDLLYERYGRLVYSVALRVIKDAQFSQCSKSGSYRVNIPRCHLLRWNRLP